MTLDISDCTKIEALRKKIPPWEISLHTDRNIVSGRGKDIRKIAWFEIPSKKYEVPLRC